MEALAAVGLVSGIFQIIDFSGKLIFRSKDIYSSANGSLNLYNDLENAVKQLQELLQELIREAAKVNIATTAEEQNRRYQLQAAGRMQAQETTVDAWKGRESKRKQNPRKPTEPQQNRVADEQLFKLYETTKITKKIILAIQRLKSRKPNTKLQSVRQAFRSILSNSEFKALEQSVENIRKQTQTALLFSLR
jgi:hypothetical protein